MPSPAAEPALFTTKDFVPDASGADERVEEHAVGDRTQVDGSDLLLGFPCGGDWDTRSTCDLLGEERAE
jgi:hypothetical protein